MHSSNIYIMHIKFINFYLKKRKKNFSIIRKKNTKKCCFFNLVLKITSTIIKIILKNKKNVKMTENIFNSVWNKIKLFCNKKGKNT